MVGQPRCGFHRHRQGFVGNRQTVKELDEIRTWAVTIRSNGQKILDRLRISTEKLERQGAVLTERAADLKEAIKKG
jgi:hypothetical protein